MTVMKLLRDLNDSELWFVYSYCRFLMLKYARCLMSSWLLFGLYFGSVLASLPAFIQCGFYMCFMSYFCLLTELTRYWDPILWNLNVRIFFVPFVASTCDRVLKHLGPVRERYRLRNKCSKDVSGDDLAEHIGTCLQ